MQEDEAALAPGELIQALDLHAEPGHLAVQQQEEVDAMLGKLALRVLSLPANSRRWQSLPTSSMTVKRIRK